MSKTVVVDVVRALEGRYFAAAGAAIVAIHAVDGDHADLAIGLTVMAQTPNRSTAAM
jgi:hypothetical protein